MLGKKQLASAALLLVLPGLVTMTTGDKVLADEERETITINGNDVDEDHRFKGFGTVSANNTTRLMMDYKEENPEAYWEIMHQLFDPETGAGLAHVKVELGADVNSSSGTEPATKRYEDEPANVLRGAGFQFAADAKSINENITTEILRWGEPRWTWEGAANQNYENRYQWYKDTMDAVEEEYGFKLDYVGVTQNERAQNGNGRIDEEWLQYFTTSLEDEPNYAEDYEDIKLVAADGYRDTSSISQTLLDHENLREDIDVISTHYEISGSDALTELQNTLKDNGKEPKEIWISEGVAPMVNARYRENMEPQYNGLGGQYGIVDVTSRIISAYSWEGAGDNPLNAVSFDFQPSISAFYEGASYNPKHLISAKDPWSGFYETDGGLQGVRHVMNFVEHDDRSTEKNERWQYVQGATYSDGEFFDGGVEVDTSTRNYMTLKDPETDDYSTVFANNTEDTRRYTIQAEQLNGKENAPVHIWETKGSKDGGAIDENWFQHTGTVTPENGQYNVEVSPYSIVTISTLDKQAEVEGFEYESDPVDTSDNTTLSLPYEDDFKYDEYGTDEEGRDYIERRGGTPRYTTDQTGAFEVVKEATKPKEQGSAERVERTIPQADEHGSMLQQKITPDIIGAEWAVWGGNDGAATDRNPTTNIGDHRWANYKASYDFLLDTHTPKAENRSNYALIGVRQVKADGGDSQAPYNAKIYEDGTYEILKMGSVVKEGTVDGFDSSKWHNIALEAKENTFTLYLDEKEIASYTDEEETVMAGRVSLGSGYYETLIDNLKIEPLDGYSYESEKIDNAQGHVYDSKEEARNNDDDVNPIGYVGDWNYSRTGYDHFNRTLMSTETDVPVWNGVDIGHQDTTDTQGTLNKVYYSGDWSSNGTNAWGSGGESFEITFKGNEIRLYGITNPSNGTADVYLDGEQVGEADYLNNSEMEQMVWSAENLEETEHTLKVVANDGYASFTHVEVETSEERTLTTKDTLAPDQFTAVSQESEISGEENTVYAYREGENDWGANSTNAWANFDDNPYILVHFTGTGIDYLAGAGEETAYNVELDGEDMGDHTVDSESGIRYSVRNLEEGQHTLKVSLGDNEAKETYMDYRGVNIYSTPDTEEKASSMVFDFEGSGFNLFGATPDALIDVYVDDTLIQEDYRIHTAGDRQTSYVLRGLENKNHTAEIVVKRGSFVLDGMDIITGTNDGETDKSSLQELFENHQDKNHKDYTKDSWKTFHKARQHAKQVLKNPQSSQIDVYAAQTSMQQAVEGLVEK